MSTLIPDSCPERWRSKGYSAMPVAHGKSGAGVWRLVSTEGPALYLKSSASASALFEEKKRYLWLQHYVPVPDVVEYTVDGSYETLILTEVAGLPSFDPSLGPEEVIKRLAEGLRRLHSIPVTECPFDMRLDTKIAMAQDNARNGRVTLDDLQPEHKGWTSEMLLAEVARTRPASEDLVVTHGDYCLPNIILSEDAARINGFIDVGYCGIADRYQDLALAWRSIRYNLGDAFVQPFFEAYGLPEPDLDKIAFSNLLDELF